MSKLLNFYIKLFDDWLYDYVIKPIWFFFILSIYIMLITQLPIIKEGLSYYYTYLFPNLGEVKYLEPLLTEKEIAIISTFLAALLGIAIPISLNIIADLDNKYNQGGISKEFLNEPLNNAQIFFLITNVFVIICALFFFEFNFWLSIFYIFYFFITVISFAAFIKLVQVYSINAKNLFSEKLKRDVKKYFQD